MDQLRSLGRRDIFGILLPGVIPIFIGAYALLATLAPFQIPLGNILDREFLVTVFLFVSAYLIGSLLRLFAADVVDQQSSKYLLKDWEKENKEDIPENYT